MSSISWKIVLGARTAKMSVRAVGGDGGFGTGREGSREGGREAK